MPLQAGVELKESNIVAARLGMTRKQTIEASLIGRRHASVAHSATEREQFGMRHGSAGPVPLPALAEILAPGDQGLERRHAGQRSGRDAPAEHQGGEPGDR